MFDEADMGAMDIKPDLEPAVDAIDVGKGVATADGGVTVDS
jgi:hypothetical protein